MNQQQYALTKHQFPHTILGIPSVLQGEGEWLFGGIGKVFIPYDNSKTAWKKVEIAQLKSFGSDLRNLELDLIELTPTDSRYVLSYRREKNDPDSAVPLGKFRLRNSQERRLLQSYRELQILKAVEWSRQLPIINRYTRPLIEYHDHNVGLTNEGKLVLYLGMERVEGSLLFDYIANRLSITSKGVVIKSLCDAVEAMHILGIEHRDLKPENVIFNGKAKIIDFGLAHTENGIGLEDLRIGRILERNYTDRVMGTPAYMAPEQIMLRPEMNSDLYSLGIIIHQILLGHPFPQLVGGRIKGRDLLNISQKYQFNQQYFDCIPEVLAQSPNGKSLRRIAGNLVEDALYDLLCYNPKARDIHAAKELGKCLAGDQADKLGTAQRTVENPIAFLTSVDVDLTFS